MSSSDWINLALGATSVFIAILTATWFAGRQNKNILKQNLELETYKEFWHSISSLNESLINLPVFAKMDLNYTEIVVTGPQMVNEQAHEEASRKRQKIIEYSKGLNEKNQEVMSAWGKLHQLWEQKEPVLSDLTVAFGAYRDEYSKLQEKLILPSQTRSSLDLENFSEGKITLDTENDVLEKECMDLLVYGIDMSRMIQKRLLSKYYKHEPVLRGKEAQSGFQLTEEGLIPVKSLTKKARNKNKRKI